jgi:succinoglycan biosynthesis protein ExoU
VHSALTEPEVAEIIVVDDASSDNTVSEAHTADDGSGRLKILKQPRNTGPAAARNRAIAESTAPWIAVLDSDDFFLPGRMRGLLTLADKADLIADDMWQVTDDAIEGPRKSLLGVPLTQPRKIDFAEFAAGNVTRRWRKRGELGFIKPLMRRTFLDAHKIRYQENMRLGEDYELYARALANGARLYIMPAQGYISVARPDSLSGRHTETDLFYLRECDEAIAKIPRLTARDRRALRKHYLSVDCRLQWRLLILAVKQRDIRSALVTFARPWPVPRYLAMRLLEQLVLRTAKILKPKKVR